MRDLEEAYRTYAPRLLAYCTALLHDRDAAADAVHDAFVTAAAKQHQLREPARFEAWLYAIARNNCKALLRVRAQQLPFSVDFDVAADTADPASAVRAEEIRELVHSAAAALSEADREIIELAIRHGLSPAALSTVLDLPANHVHARLSRARSQLERAIGVLLLARNGSDCPQLANLLDGWDGRLDSLTRKRISRHVETCERCSARRGLLASASALLGAYAGLPFLIVSTMDLKPPRFARPRRRAAKVLVPAVLVAGLIGGALALGQCERPVSSADPTSLTVLPSHQPSPRTSPQPARGSPPGPGVKAPSTHPSPPKPVPFTVAIADRTATCTTASNTYKLHVEITTSTEFATARLYWIEETWPRHSLPLAATGARSGQVTKPLLKNSTEWWVQAVAPDGRTAETEHTTVRSPCV